MIKKLFILICIMFTLCSCQKDHPLKVDTDQINVMKDVREEFSFPVHSAEYLLVDLSDFYILNGLNTDVKMYPASMTKVLTMDTVLHLADNLDDTSHVTYEQVEDLIREDASLAYIQRDYEYSLRDLLYALVLPSGADGAVALENYFADRGIDLVEEMNKLASELGCTNSHFVNTTGLHDDDHYTCLDDLYLIVMDVMKNEEGRKVMESLKYKMADDTIVYTTIGIQYRDPDVLVLGGKTGYTPEAGQNIMTFFKNRSKSYLLILGNAYGDYASHQYWHFEDALTVFEQLF
ncbi:MAG: D-alanyl-D-alanine carboxypeptidase [Erysipelotrichaceae bacterium]|nr:D-alanyl-D-alanine carboxypeptidase [Erysipelotrichaceae bacterium]